MKRPKDLSFQKACFISEVGFDTEAYISWLADEGPTYISSSDLEYQHDKILEDENFCSNPKAKAIISKLYKLVKEFQIDVIILDYNV